MAKGNKTKKKSPVLIVLITLLSLTVVTFLIVVCAFFASISNKNQNESYVGSGAINAIATEQVSVKINMENCTMTVGTKVLVTATIYPDGSSSGIIWTSSDESVFTVDSKGNLEVLAPGIVALTANFGDAYDSIAIECVESGDNAVLNLPDYSMFTQNGGNNTANKPSDSASNTSPDSTASAGNKNETTGQSKAPASDSSSTASSGTTAETTKPSVSQTTTAVTVVTTAATDAAVTSGDSHQETTSYVMATTPAYEGVKVLSTQIAENLPGYGFKQYLDNTYVFEENESYLGEIIISSNMTHIYIKDRSTGLDSAINSVLTELLPDSHDTVWNIYSGATTDQTMTVDGRVVRVVVPSDGGHSQIVIYN